MRANQPHTVGTLAGTLAGALSLVFLLALSSCSGAKQELDLVPVTLSTEPALESGAPVQEAIGDGGEAIESSIPEALPAPQVDTGKDAWRFTVVVVEGGKEVPAVTSSRLLAASRNEKERRANTAPVAVITNENLKESGIGGQLTFTTVASPQAGADADEPAGDAVQNKRVEEEYWRSGALEVRLSWKAAVTEVTDLQAEVAQLRRRFYAEDDPHYRDNEIKPAWDRALERLAVARREADDYRQRVTEFLESGRAAGALAGWLREGLEYEPAPTDDSPRRRDDPNEPEIVDEDRWIDP